MIDEEYYLNARKFISLKTQIFINVSKGLLYERPTKEEFEGIINPMDPALYNAISKNIEEIFGVKKDQSKDIKRVFKDLKNSRIINRKRLPVNTYFEENLSLKQNFQKYYGYVRSTISELNNYFDRLAFYEKNLKEKNFEIKK